VFQDFRSLTVTLPIGAAYLAVDKCNQLPPYAVTATA
jgi:hypothetical protein